MRRPGGSARRSAAAGGPPGRRVPGDILEYEHPSGREPDQHELASALAQLHRALLGYSGPLSSYRDELSAVADVLGDEARAPPLAADDRAVLLAALARFGPELAQQTVAERPLHGAPQAPTPS